MDNILVAAFAHSYFNISSASQQTIVIDASPSRDIFTGANRNFTYNWECSLLIPIALCPAAGTNISQIVLS